MQGQKRNRRPQRDNHAATRGKHAAACEAGQATQRVYKATPCHTNLLWQRSVAVHDLRSNASTSQATAPAPTTPNNWRTDDIRADCTSVASTSTVFLPGHELHHKTSQPRSKLPRDNSTYNTTRRYAHSAFRSVVAAWQQVVGGALMCGEHCAHSFIYPPNRVDTREVKCAQNQARV